MPPAKGGNAKKEGGRAKKAENEEKKKDVVNKAVAAKVAKEWEDGAKGLSKQEVAAAKAAEAARKKQEREALLAAEEASLPSKPKAAPKAGAAKKKPDSGVLAPAAGKGIASFTTNDPLGLRGSGLGDDEGEPVAELSARGVEEMLEALEVVNQKTSKDALGAKAGLIEAHPEKRFKAAFEAYLEREIPILRDEHPGLRQNQMRDKLFKKFERSPENPFNQVSVEYNTTKGEKVEKLKEVMAAREKKYKTIM
ncbi:uncharacterized protein MKK02DRAFT_45792 [Dioszegia hungarica]|uniref:DUF1014-domain-containing protein n=1 Tax=Dioszegia hungarica TaxID=4972 RepID=A0AA38HCG4_9TREE|nr:uncharacterized protein MKK02DRAFT_45792 [Dioszegia hungarica]KAI9637084.1 hypothetical protein MKK02DRAFT_45792 [Dioszegia hungarica]